MDVLDSPSPTENNLLLKNCYDKRTFITESSGDGKQPQKDTFSLENFFNLMKFERLRLITYILYGHQWPKMNIISPTSLAKAGFFYLKSDCVQCAFCRGIVSKWEQYDVAFEEHKRHFPSCPFVNGFFCGNVPLELDPEINIMKNSVFIDENPSQEPIKINYNKSILPRFPIFADIFKRVISFTNSNWDNKLNTKDFVDAGFFYSGNGDRTLCFQCGGLLFNWKPEENPMEEHAYFFPECSFVIRNKGELYLDFVKFKKEIIEMRYKMDTPNGVKVSDINCMRKLSFEDFMTMKQSALKIMNKLETEKKTKINSYYSEYLKKFFFFIDCQKLFNYLIRLNILKSNENDESSQLNSSIFSLAESSDSDYSSDECEDLNKNKENKEKHKSQLTCSICYEKDIQVVFVPCGHQLACMNCATLLDICPICRATIANKIRTYFVFKE